MRTSFLNEINAVLSNGPFFELTDFKIEQSKHKDGDTLLNITYEPDSSFKVLSRIPLTRTKVDYSEEFVISANVFPGEINTNEYLTFNGKSKLLAGLAEWRNRVYEELMAIPVLRRSEEQRQQIEKILEDLGDLDESYFTKDEANTLKDRLDDLEARFAESIKMHLDDKTAQEQQLGSLHAEISDLKAKTDTRTKRGWARSFAKRFVEWSEDPENRKLLGTGVEVVKGLIEAGKSIGIG